MTVIRLDRHLHSRDVGCSGIVVWHRLLIVVGVRRSIGVAGFRKKLIGRDRLLVIDLRCNAAGQLGVFGSILIMAPAMDRLSGIEEQAEGSRRGPQSEGRTGRHRLVAIESAQSALSTPRAVESKCAERCSMGPFGVIFPQLSPSRPMRASASCRCPLFRKSSSDDPLSELLRRRSGSGAGQNNGGILSYDAVFTAPFAGEVSCKKP